MGHLPLSVTVVSSITAFCHQGVGHSSPLFIRVKANHDILSPRNSSISVFWQHRKGQRLPSVIKDPKKHITDLANFLDVPYTDEFINDIVIKCSFKNLKDHKLDVCSIIDTDKKSTLFRKGIIGDWKNWFTVAQNEQMEAIYNKEMKDVDVKFKYE
ncbi:SULT1 [Mytilus edulis]|uniref:SULT1 n=1 Tax=Mytilus edulis TaxID=6550 RepID=A0A8S3R0C3_MYTED|nr:SULT1 [Mytilus edulis]